MRKITNELRGKLTSAKEFLSSIEMQIVLVVSVVLCILTLDPSARIWGNVLSVYIFAIAGLCVCKGIMNHGFSFSILKEAVSLPSMMIGYVCFVIVVAEVGYLIANHILVAIIAGVAIVLFFFLKEKSRESTKTA